MKKYESILGMAKLFGVLGIVCVILSFIAPPAIGGSTTAIISCFFEFLLLALVFFTMSHIIRLMIDIAENIEKIANK